MSTGFDFASLMESSEKQAVRVQKRLRPGEIVEGKVVQIGRDSLFVDVGATVEARIDRMELEDKQGVLSVKIGDSIRASVVSAGDVNGPVLTTALGRGKKSGIDVIALQQAKESGLPVEGTITGAKKAGLEVQIGGVRAFCPASQVGRGFVADLEALVGESHQFLITELKEEGRNVIVSRRALLDQENAQKTQEVLSQLSVGGQYEGTVASVQKYGAFVELGGGVDGLIHISELAHARVDRVEDVLQIGERVTVKVLAIEPSEKGPIPKLRLSMKALSEAPEVDIPQAGVVLDGTVASVGSFGVFVETAKGQGLVPVRELGLPRGADFRRAFPEGKAVRVVLVNRGDSGKTTFSISRVAQVEERQNYREFARSGGGDASKSDSGRVGTLGALLMEKLQLPEPTAPAPKAAALTTQQVQPVPSTSQKPSSATTARPAYADGLQRRRR